MNPMTILLILALSVAIWWFVRKRRESVADDATTEVRKAAENTQFHAVSIRFSGQACDPELHEPSHPRNPRYHGRARHRGGRVDCDLGRHGRRR